MKKLKEIFNFKNKKSISIACLIAVLITVSTIGILKHKVNNDFENFGTKSGEDLNTEISEAYKKLSENLYEVNEESHTIYFKDSNIGMFCLSDSENGPTAQDKWIKVDGTKEVEIDADSINKRYVYYLEASIVNSNVGIIGDTNTNITTYIISTYEDFVNFRTLVNSGTTFEGKTVSLNKDISLATERENYTPIGTSTNPFKGTFNGNGYEITDLIISNTSLDYAGLFGYVVDGTIKNLTISGTTGISAKNYVGAFVGNLSGTLENCINNTDVTGVGYAGGLVGVLTDGEIRYCRNNNAVKTTDTKEEYSTGGIVAIVTKGTIYNCVNYGDITTSYKNSAGIAGKIGGETTVKYCENFGTITSTSNVAGGIIGRIAEGVTVNAENCKNSGVIASSSHCAGGIIGDAAGNNTLTINNCINVASVTATNRHAGGIIGTSNVKEGALNKRESTSTTTITNCFNSGDIQSTSGYMAGGIIGSAWGSNTIDNCGNTGNVSVPISSDRYYAAGIAGMLVGTSNVTYCYNTGNMKGYRFVAGIACSPNESAAKTTITHCYSKGQMKVDQKETNAGIAVLYSSSATLTASNNYFYGSYVDENGAEETEKNGLYVKNSKVVTGDNVSDFSVYSDYFTQNNYGLLDDGDWLLKWQVPATLIRNPFDIYEEEGTMDVVTYGAEGNFTYQWYNASDRTSTGTAILGATSSTLTLPVAGATGDYYYCVVTSKNDLNNAVTTKSESAFYGEKITEKIELEVPTISGTYTYNGTEQTLVLNDFDENYMSINQTKATDAGTIEIQISLNDTARYSWSDKTTETKKLNWVIAKKQVTAVWGTQETFTYDGKEHAPIVTAETGIANEELVIVRTTAINTGNHTSTATIEKVIGGTGNAKNYELLNASKSFAINSSLTDIAVSIQGKNEYDQLLTAKIDTEIPNLKYQYQWYSNTTASTTGGIAIAGATSRNYIVGEDLVGKYIYVAVTASKENYETKTVNCLTTLASNTSATVLAKSISSAGISLKVNAGYMQGTSELISVTDGNKTLTKGEDYTMSYTNLGTSDATVVTVTGLANYVGTLTKTFSGISSKVREVRVMSRNYTDGTNYYETLNAAFSNANSGSTITVLKDVTESTQAEVESGKSFVLDLNGKTITVDANGSENFYFIHNSGNLEVKDSKGNGKINLTVSQEDSTYGTSIFINWEGNLTITSGTYDITGTIGYTYTVRNIDGTLNINGGTIIARATGSMFVAAVEPAGGNLNITGGTIRAYDETNEQYVYGVVNTAQYSANIKITGGDIYSDVNGVELTNHTGGSGVQTSTLEVSGSPTIEGGKYGIGIWCVTGNVQVKSGTIKGGTAGIRQTTGKIKIGDSSDKVSTTSPVIQGGIYGVDAQNSFEFYDGILKGKTSAYSVEPDTIPTGYGVYNDTETIDGEEYKTAYLAPYLMEREYIVTSYNPGETVPDLQPHQYKTGVDGGTIFVYSMYAIGAGKANKTQYTSDKIKNITIVDNINIPSGADSWDASMAQDGSIMAWVVANEEMYNLYIGSNGKMFTPANSFNLFAHYINCESITGLQHIDTRYTTSMSRMFGVSKVSALDLSGFNTENVETMSYMFRSCENLTELNLDSFKTGKLETMDSMFNSCSNLENISWKNIDTTNVTNMCGLFANCSKLSEIDLSNFKTEKVTNMQSMFLSCNSLSKISVNKFNTSNVTNMSHMFRNCESLTELDVSNFDTSKVTDMSYMFVGCLKLTDIDLSNFDTRKVTNVEKMFKNDYALKTIHLGSNFDKINGFEMFTSCTNLTAIIAKSTTPMTLSTDVGVESLTKLYVPTTTAETAYEGATYYLSVFGAERIQPILELVGESQMRVPINYNYIEKGVTVAGMNKNSDDTYTPYGYTVSGPVITSDVNNTGLVDTIVPGEYRVTYTIYDSSNTAGMSVTRIVIVEHKDLTLAEVEIPDYTYTGEEIIPDVIVRYGGVELIEHKDYEITAITDNIDAGVGFVTLIGIGDYDGTLEQQQFLIARKSVTVVWNEATFTYNGQEQAPTATVSSEVTGETINLSVTKAINVGSYTAVASIASVIGGQAKASNYTLTNATKAFTITTREITVTAKDASKVYDGTALTYADVETPGYTIGENELVTGHTIDVTRSGSITNVGTTPHVIGNVAIKDASGNAVTDNYTVAKVNGTLAVTAAGSATLNITLNDAGPFTYNGQAHIPGITVTANETTLDATTDYDVAYTNNVNAGTATITVTGKGNYLGSINSTTFTINKASATVTASITGETIVGKVLTATATSVSSGNKSYQWWYSSTESATSGTAISGATSSIYTVTSSVVGYYIGVTVNVAETKNYNASSATAITTSKVIEANYKDSEENYYETLNAAFSNANSGSTITVLKDVTESTQAEVESGKSFVLDLNGKTITVDANGSVNFHFIHNRGDLELKDSKGNGKIELTVSQEELKCHTGIFVNWEGNLTITSGTYDITGTIGYSYTISIIDGTLNVNGGTIIASATNSTLVAGVTPDNGNINITGGTIRAYDETNERFVYGVVNTAYGSTNIKITGGDIYSDVKGVDLTDHTGGSGVLTSTLEVSGSPTIEGGIYGIEIDGATGNVQVKSGTIKGGTAGIRQTTGKIKIGDSSDKVSTTSPVIQGGIYGVDAQNSFEFYDGILKGKTSAYSVEPDTIPTGYEVYNDTETIDGEEYKTAYLVPYLMQRETQETTDENGNKSYSNQYMLGAERAGLTQYTSDLVSSITFHNTINIPNGAENWDVSLAEDESIMAWLISDGNEKYELHIGANSIMFGYTGHRLFAEYINCKSINDLSLLDTSKVTDMFGMFLYNQSLLSFDIKSFDTSNVTNMSYMFAWCEALTSLDVSGFDTSNVTDMSYMFAWCEALTSLDVSGFDTSKVTDMSLMFSKCKTVTTLDVRSFDTSNVTNMLRMFDYCTKLATLDVSRFNTSKVTCMFKMFSYCESLASLDVSGFDTSKVTDMSYMFIWCSTLTKLNVSNFDTSQVTNMSNMFFGCKGLTNLDLSNFDTTNVTEMGSMFESCTNLKTIHLGKNFDKLTGKDMFTGCTSLTAIITQKECLTPSLENIQVGDYIAYDNSNKSYTTDSTNTGTTSVTLTPDETKWRVLSVNQESGTVLIATEDIVNANQVTLYGINGYMNGPEELDKICNALYGNEELGITARSMTVEDLNALCGYTPSDLEKVAYYPTGTYASGTTDDGYEKRDHGWGDARFYESDKGGSTGTDSYGYTYKTPTSSNPVYVTDSYYKYSPIEKNEELKNILGKSYGWLASRCVNNFVTSDNKNIAYFGVFYINESEVDAPGLYGSFGAEGGHTFGLRPIITLSASDLNVSQSGESSSGSGSTITGNSGSNSVMLLSADTGLENLPNAILYVPNATSETNYENATNYETVFGEDRIKPILELVGEDEVELDKGTTYTDEGVTVAGFSDEQAVNYTQYGYAVSEPVITKDGVQVERVDTSSYGTYKLEYTLYYTNPNVQNSTATKVMSVTRTVEINSKNYSVNGIYYPTLADAYAGVHGVEGTIKVERDNVDDSNFVVEANKEITLDLNGKTITKTTTGLSNNGVLTIQGNGTIQTLEYADNIVGNIIFNNGILNVKEATLHNKATSRSHWSTIYSNSGTVNIESGKLKISGNDSNWLGRAIYIQSGIVNIIGGAIESTYLGIEAYDNSTGTINITGGEITATYSIGIVGSNNQTNLYVIGGTLKSNNGYAIKFTSTGKLIIGDNSNDVTRTTPIIQGETYGVDAQNSFEFYDGILKGKTSAYSVEPDTIPTGYEVYNDTETIDGEEYKTAYLVPKFIVSDVGPFTYNGQEYKPEVTVKANGTTLNAETDYDVVYTNNVNAGTATITVTGKGDYKGSKGTTTFEITKKEITVKLTDASKIYDGTPLASNTYSLTSGSLASGHTIAVIANGSQTEIGSSANIISKVTIKNSNGEDVTSNYEVTTENGLLTVTGETISGSVTIEGDTEVGKTLIANTIEITPANCDFEYKWYVTAEKSLTGGTLITNENDDVYVVRESDVGKYIYVEVIATWKGTVTTTFKNITNEVIRKSESGGDIDSGDREVDVETKNLNSTDITIKLPSDYDYTYDDTEKEPAPIVKDSGKLLEEDKDYTVDYEDNIDANEGEDDKSKVIIKGKGDYSGEVIKEFEITKRKITVKLTDASKAYDGTPLTSNDYSLTGSLVTGHTMTVTADGSQTDVGESTNSISNITITNGSGKDVTSNYNVTKEAGTLTVTADENVKFTITLNDAGPFTYNGQAHTPGITVKVGDKELIKDTDYTVGYSNNVNAGKATITVTGKGNYVGSQETMKFNISTKTLQVEWGTTTEFVYNGKPQAPTATVNSEIEGETVNLKVTGSATNVGSYTATASIESVTGGQADANNYTLTGATKGFTITARKVTLTSASASKVYDGTPLTATGVTASAKTETEGIVDVDTLSATANGTITNLGSVKNTFTYDILRNGTSVKENYDVTEVEGTLTVTNAEIKGSVTIEGSAVIGSTLTANTDAIDPTGCDLTYKWFYNETNSTSGGTEISGATNKTYTIESGLTGKYIYVEVTASKANYEEKTFKDITDSSNSTDGKVKPKDFTKVTVELPDNYDYTYDDTEKKPIPVVKDGDNELKEGKDYTVDYEDNIDANEGEDNKSKVIITGSGDYSGKITEKFEITKRKITIKPLDAEKDYDGTALTSSEYELISGTLVTGHKLTITTTGSQTEIGSGENTISTLTIVDDNGKDVKPNYNITTEKGTLTVKGVYIDGNVEITGVTRVGKLLVANVIDVTPAGCKFTYKWYVSDTNSMENGTLIEGENEIGYIVRESDLGKYIYVEVTAKRSASPIKVFKDITDEVIAPSGTTGEVDSGDREVDVLPVISGKVVITGDNVYGSTLTANTDNVVPSDCNLTYQWYYSEYGDGTDMQEIVGATNKTYVVGDNTEESLIGKYIYVKVHAEKENYSSADFIDVTDAENNKFDKVEEKDISSPDVTITLDKDEFTYDGTEHTPDVVVKHNGKTLEEGKDYEINYKNNIDAGSGEVEITGKGNYEGTVIKEFKIKPMEISVPWGSNTEFVYNGNPQAPSVGTAQGAKDEKIYFERTTKVNAGEYTSKASIEKVVGGREKAENYTLINDTKAYKIAKATATLTLSSYSVEVVEGNKVKVTYEYVGDGAISYTEIDRNIATFEVKGKEITITGIKEGTTTLKLSASGKNYTDVTATISIKVLSANYTVTNGEDSTNYEKLQDAIDAAESGDTIIVNKDVTEPDGATVDKDITIDLKDKTITTEEPIVVKPDAEVTIVADTNDNGETGTIKNPDGTAIDNEGTINIGDESGDRGPVIDGKDKAIDSEDGDFNFNDGKLIGDDNPPYKGEPETLLGKYIETKEEDGRYVSELKEDTVPPVISLYEDKDIVMGPSDKVGLLVDIFEAGSGLDISEFSEGDLIYEVNGERVYPTYERITFVNLINNNTYRYYLEFSGIRKSGSLTIRVDKDMVFDKAGLGNEATILTEGKIVIDITAPDLSNAELVLIKPENGVTEDGEYEAKISGATDDNGIGEYQWEIRKDGEDEWEIIGNDATNNSTSYISGAVEEEGKYYIRVKVSDLIGNSTYSNMVSFTYEKPVDYNAKPTIKFSKQAVKTGNVVTSVKIHTIIKSTTSLVSIKVNGIEISNLSEVLSGAVVEGKFQIRTEFDYDAYANTTYKFEAKDSKGNISTAICNVSEFNREAAKISYEIIDASVYGNAKIVFTSNEPVKLTGTLPNGFSINETEANRYSTTVVVDIAENVKDIDEEFKFINTVNVETKVRVVESVEAVARNIRTVFNKSVTINEVYGNIGVAKANNLTKKMKNAKQLKNSKVDSYYGISSTGIDFKVSSGAEIEAVKTLGGAGNIQIVKSEGNVAELEKSTTIIGTATSGITASVNDNMTGVYLGTDIITSDSTGTANSFHVTIINQ